jgi:hypothetical protein
VKSHNSCKAGNYFTKYFDKNDYHIPEIEIPSSVEAEPEEEEEEESSEDSVPEPGPQKTEEIEVIGEVAEES